MPNLKPIRACCACGAEASARVRKPAVKMVGVSLLILRRGAGKFQTSAAGSVRICEPCLIKAMAARSVILNAEARKLFMAIQAKLAHRYEQLVDADQMEMDNEKVWKDLRASLPFPSADQGAGK